MSKIKSVVLGLGLTTALGIASLPVATFAATSSQSVAVKVNVSSVIALSADNLSTEVTMTPSALDTTTLKTKLTVATNSKNGYKLTVKDADSTTAMASTDTTETIPAQAGNLVAGTAGWNLTGGDLTKVAISQMTYGVATGTAQAQGTYMDTIVYTATTL